MSYIVIWLIALIFFILSRIFSFFSDKKDIEIGNPPKSLKEIAAEIEAVLNEERVDPPVIPKDQKKIASELDVALDEEWLDATWNEEWADPQIGEVSPEIVKKFEYRNIIPYLDFKNIECFYHFTERRNLKSILKSGGLMSFQELRNRQINVLHSSNELSWELDAKKGLSNYIRLSFVKNHPMFWKAKYEKNYELIWIQIDREIAIWENTKFTDKNATDKNVKLGNDLGFLKTIDYDAIHKSKDGYNTLHEEEKKHAQSEILVERFIPKKYFLNLSELERMI